MLGIRVLIEKYMGGWYCGIVGYDIACDASIPFRCQLKF